MKKSFAKPALINPIKPNDRVTDKARLAIDLLSTKPSESLALVTELLEQDTSNSILWVIATRANQQLGQFFEAEECVNKALAITPYSTEVVYAKSNLLFRSERYEEAEIYLQDAISKLDAKLTHVLWALLGTVLQKQKKYEQAEIVYKRLTEECPDDWLHWNNLGMVCQELSRFEEMEKAYKKSSKVTEDNPTPYFNHIVGSHYHPDRTAEQILALCKNWQRKFKPEKVTRADAKIKTANKRLRIGMISDGLRLHPVGNMITLGLGRVSESQMEFYAYSTNYKEDHITHRIKRICSKWQVIENISPDELNKIIRDDEIDILFDLSGYNANSRMQTLQMAPAPIQIKWVGGLISSTGLETMDYLLSDNIETPDGSDALYTEKLIRLPDDYICYDPPFYLPPVNKNPVHRNGFITFGCFNNASKINDALLAQWAEILHAVPASRLFLKSFNFANDALKERVFIILESYGISRDRIRIEGSSPHKELLESYNDVDIALDPWPYSGGLTTCEAMVMGVPVVTLPGPTFAGRHSASHLVNAGLQELVASDWEQYINITVGMTKDLDSLDIIRSNLRDILLASPVCNGQLFAKNFSDAMRAVWQRYCEGKQPEALTLSNDAAPYFHDENQPVELQYAPEMDTASVTQTDNGFHFQVEGKVFMIDNGGSFVTGNQFIRLADLDAFHFIIMDTIGVVEEKHFPLRRKAIQHITLHTLGDGKSVPVYICLDTAISSDLKPLAAIESAPNVISDKQIITEVYAQSSRLDTIHGLETLEWLVLDNKFNIARVFENGHRILSESLVIDVRISFVDTHKGQMPFNDISAVLKEFGFYFHSFKDIEFAPSVATDDQNTLPSSHMVAAHGLWLPDAKRLAAMTVGQREKLAFIMHAVYGLQDVVYATLKSTSQERADHYLASLKGSESTASMATNSVTTQAKPVGPIIPLMPRMSVQETALFEHYLKQSKAYFEFGSGGSTKLATRNEVEVFGVESDKFWVDTLKKEAGPLCKVDYVDIGPTKEWGYPVDNTHREKFPLYSQAIMQHDKAFDLILVDGRFRVACTLNAIKQTLEKQKDIDDTVIFIHDFWDRPDYHSVLAFLETRDKAETAGAFKIKRKIDINALTTMLDKYQYIAA